jgi:hypothetical protein
VVMVGLVGTRDDRAHEVGGGPRLIGRIHDCSSRLLLYMHYRDWSPAPPELSHPDKVDHS